MITLCNQSKIWSSRSRSIEFLSIFDTNWHFSVKPNTNPFLILSQNLKNLTLVKTDIPVHYM
jgi:hypothetical protein